MPAREKGDERLVDHALLADDSLRHHRAHARERVGDLLWCDHLIRFLSMWSIAAPAGTSCSGVGLFASALVRMSMSLPSAGRRTAKKVEIAGVAELRRRSERMPAANAAHQSLCGEPGGADGLVRARECADVLEWRSALVARAGNRRDRANADHEQIEQPGRRELHCRAPPGRLERAPPRARRARTSPRRIPDDIRRRPFACWRAESMLSSTRTASTAPAVLRKTSLRRKVGSPIATTAPRCMGSTAISGCSRLACT